MALTYEPIATTTLGSATATITFSSIPATYTDLKIVFSYIGAGNSIRLRFNNDSGTNYAMGLIQGNGTTAVGDRSTSQVAVFLPYYNTLGTNIPGLMNIDVFSYAGSTNKTSLLMAYTDSNGSGGVEVDTFVWINTSAINRVDLYANSGTMPAGTIATIYGIKAA